LVALREPHDEIEERSTTERAVVALECLDPIATPEPRLGPVLAARDLVLRRPRREQVDRIVEDAPPGCVGELDYGLLEEDRAVGAEVERRERDGVLLPAVRNRSEPRAALRRAQECADRGLVGLVRVPILARVVEVREEPEIDALLPGGRGLMPRRHDPRAGPYARLADDVRGWARAPRLIGECRAHPAAHRSPSLGRSRAHIAA